MCSGLGAGVRDADGGGVCVDVVEGAGVDDAEAGDGVDDCDGGGGISDGDEDSDGGTELGVAVGEADGGIVDGVAVGVRVELKDGNRTNGDCVGDDEGAALADGDCDGRIADGELVADADGGTPDSLGVED
jgi:hypothetical protein